MTIETWLIFTAAYLVTTMSPGPNVLLVVRNSLRHGRESAIITIAGNLLCQLFIVIWVSMGIGAIIEKSPPIFMAMKIAGASYLIFMGIKELRSGKSKDLRINEIVRDGKVSELSIFCDAFLVSASNPKTILFLSAFLPQFLNNSKALAPQFTIMFVTISFIVTVIHLLYAFSVYRFRQGFSQSRIGKYLSTVTGSLFITIGCGVLLSEK